MALKLPSSFF